MLSSSTDQWATPQTVFDALDREFAFTLDPCATLSNAKCSKFFTRAQDGLAQGWRNEVVFMNPPYGAEVGRWMRKAQAEAAGGATVVCLVAARTDTRWWHQTAMHAHEIRLIRGRLRFGNARSSAPFASALVIFHRGQPPPSPVIRTWTPPKQRTAA